MTPPDPSLPPGPRNVLQTPQRIEYLSRNVREKSKMAMPAVTRRGPTEVMHAGVCTVADTGQVFSNSGFVP